MRACYWVLMVVLCARFANGQSAPQQCSDFSQSTALSSVDPSNTKEHLAGGFHAWGVTPITSCIYTHGKTQNVQHRMPCGINWINRS